MQTLQRQVAEFSLFCSVSFSVLSSMHDLFRKTLRRIRKKAKQMLLHTLESLRVFISSIEDGHRGECNKGEEEGTKLTEEEEEVVTDKI
jgi:N-formylglutamate amidohydrolase